jgi:hypothetical protein
MKRVVKLLAVLEFQQAIRDNPHLEVTFTGCTEWIVGYLMTLYQL